MSEEARPPADRSGGEQYVTIQEAADLLKVSRFKMARIAKDQRLPTYERGLDRRVRWLRRSDVEAARAALLAPRPRVEAAA